MSDLQEVEVSVDLGSQEWVVLKVPAFNIEVRGHSSKHAVARLKWALKKHYKTKNK